MAISFLEFSREGYKWLINFSLQVDFFWINKDQQSFEWFSDLLSQLEIEQGGAIEKFLSMHIYTTSLTERTELQRPMVCFML